MAYRTSTQMMGTETNNNNETDKYKLKKDGTYWRIYSKRARKTTVLRKSKDANDVHFEGSMLDIDDILYDIEEDGKGNVKLVSLPHSEVEEVETQTEPVIAVCDFARPYLSDRSSMRQQEDLRGSSPVNQQGTMGQECEDKKNTKGSKEENRNVSTEHSQQQSNTDNAHTDNERKDQENRDIQDPINDQQNVADCAGQNLPKVPPRGADTVNTEDKFGKHGDTITGEPMSSETQEGPLDTPDDGRNRKEGGNSDKSKREYRPNYVRSLSKPETTEGQKKQFSPSMYDKPKGNDFQKEMDSKEKPSATGSPDQTLNNQTKQLNQEVKMAGNQNEELRLGSGADTSVASSTGENVKASDVLSAPPAPNVVGADADEIDKQGQHNIAITQQHEKMNNKGDSNTNSSQENDGKTTKVPPITPLPVTNSTAAGEDSVAQQLANTHTQVTETEKSGTLENDDYKLQKNGAYWIIESKRTKKRTLLRKFKNATDVHFEEAVLIIDDTFFDIEEDGKGNVKLVPIVDTEVEETETQAEPENTVADLSERSSMRQQEDLRGSSPFNQQGNIRQDTKETPTTKMNEQGPSSGTKSPRQKPERTKQQPPIGSKFSRQYVKEKVNKYSEGNNGPETSIHTSVEKKDDEEQKVEAELADAMKDATEDRDNPKEDKRQESEDKKNTKGNKEESKHVGNELSLQQSNTDNAHTDNERKNQENRDIQEPISDQQNDTACAEQSVPKVSPSGADTVNTADKFGKHGDTNTGQPRSSEAQEGPPDIDTPDDGRNIKEGGNSDKSKRECRPNYGRGLSKPETTEGQTINLSLSLYDKPKGNDFQKDIDLKKKPSGTGLPDPILDNQTKQPNQEAKIAVNQNEEMRFGRVADTSVHSSTGEKVKASNVLSAPPAPNAVGADAEEIDKQGQHNDAITQQHEKMNNKGDSNINSYQEKDGKTTKLPAITPLTVTNSTAAGEDSVAQQLTKTQTQVRETETNDNLENDYYKLKKEGSYWIIYSKRADKATVLRKFKNANDAHFEGKMLDIDDSLFEIKENGKGIVKLIQLDDEKVEETETLAEPENTAGSCERPDLSEQSSMRQQEDLRCSFPVNQQEAMGPVNTTTQGTQSVTDIREPKQTAPEKVVSQSVDKSVSAVGQSTNGTMKPIPNTKSASSKLENRDGGTGAIPKTNQTLKPVEDVCNDEEQKVEVICQYKDTDNKIIMSKGDELILTNCKNKDWWYVIGENFEGYVPANNLKILPSIHHHGGRDRAMEEPSGKIETRSKKPEAGKSFEKDSKVIEQRGGSPTEEIPPSRPTRTDKSKSKEILTTKEMNEQGASSGTASPSPRRTIPPMSAQKGHADGTKRSTHLRIPTTEEILYPNQDRKAMDKSHMSTRINVREGQSTTETPVQKSKGSNSKETPTKKDMNEQGTSSGTTSPRWHLPVPRTDPKRSNSKETPTKKDMNEQGTCSDTTSPRWHLPVPRTDPKRQESDDTKDTKGSKEAKEDADKAVVEDRLRRERELQTKLEKERQAALEEKRRQQVEQDRLENEKREKLRHEKEQTERKRLDGEKKQRDKDRRKAIEAKKAADEKLRLMNELTFFPDEVSGRKNTRSMASGADSSMQTNAAIVQHQAKYTLRNIHGIWVIKKSDKIKLRLQFDDPTDVRIEENLLFVDGKLFEIIEDEEGKPCLIPLLQVEITKHPEDFLDRGIMRTTRRPLSAKLHTRFEYVARKISNIWIVTNQSLSRTYRLGLDGSENIKVEEHFLLSGSCLYEIVESKGSPLRLVSLSSAKMRPKVDAIGTSAMADTRVVKTKGEYIIRRLTCGRIITRHELYRTFRLPFNDKKDVHMVDEFLFVDGQLYEVDMDETGELNLDPLALVLLKTTMPTPTISKHVVVDKIRQIGHIWTLKRKDASAHFQLTFDGIKNVHMAEEFIFADGELHEILEMDGNLYIVPLQAVQTVARSYENETSEDEVETYVCGDNDAYGFDADLASDEYTSFIFPQRSHKRQTFGTHKSTAYTKDNSS